MKKKKEKRRYLTALNPGGIKVTSRANYNRKVAKTTDPKKRMQLKAALELHRRAKRQNRLRAHHINLTGEDKTRQHIATQMMRLAGVLQDLMRLSGTSLSMAVHDFIARYTGQRGAKVGMRAAATAVVLTPKHLLGWIVSYMATNYGIITEITGDTWHKVERTAKKTIVGVLTNKNVDIRPLVGGIIMNLDAYDVKKIAEKEVDKILKNYVYNSSSKEGSFLCSLCKQTRKSCTSCSAGNSCPKPTTGAEVASVIRRALLALNELLKYRKQTVTKVARAVAETQGLSRDSYLIGTLGYTAAKIADSTVANRILNYFKANQFLAKFGLAFKVQDALRVFSKHASAVSAFIRKDYSRSIEPLLLDLITVAQPQDLMRGMTNVTIRGKTNSTVFCKMCYHAYPKC